MLKRISNKREFVAKAFTTFGFVRALEAAARRPGVLVLTYHRIGVPEASPFYEGVYSASAEAFRAHVRQLQRRFALITMEGLVAAAESGFAVDRPTALITFDDGYRDNLELALPILKELNAPATFFIPTAFLDSPQLPWWDHVAYVLKKTERTTVTLAWPEPMVLELGQGPRSAAIAKVIALFLEGKIADEPRFRTHLEERAEVTVEDSLARTLFMNWDEVRGLTEAGMSVGSHAVTHKNLGRLSEAEQRGELFGSRETLERELRREVRALAYPYGWPGSYNDATLKLAREAGYRLAFVSDAGINRPGALGPLTLHRLNIGYRDSPPLLRARLALQGAFGVSFL